MLKPNPYLKKLGFSTTDRVVIFHADDIGMCQGSVSAYADLLDFGILSSAAMMVPCSWFPAAAACFHQHRHLPHLDVGVHLTLTSEWTDYRWRPVSTFDPSSGLLDSEGYLHKLAEPVQTQAGEAAVEQELRTQIDHALAAGLELTHVDTHMLTLIHPRLLPVYFRVAQHYQLPAFMVRGDVAFWRSWNFDEDTAVALENYTEVVEEQGLPLFDHFYGMSLTARTDRLAEAARALAACPAGLTHFIIHPVTDTPELRAMAPDWRSRVADYELFTSEAWRQVIAESGVQVIGYRSLCDAMRGSRYHHET
jgi:predicted glycoside hydrolase/deacetylase ChbG (UPF0249 family)